MEAKALAVRGSVLFVSICVLVSFCQTGQGISTDSLMISNGPLMINESSTIVLACPGSGEIFWKLNNTIVTYGNTDGFSAVGISVTSDAVTVQGSAGSNNTDIGCEWIDSGDGDVGVSGIATIIVIGAPTMPNVTLTDDFSDSNSFSLSWPVPYSPPEYNITQYTVSVTDTLRNEVYAPSVMGESEDIFTSLIFVVPGESLPLQLCSQLIFQVTAVSDIGESAPGVVTWENPEAALLNIGAAEDVQCEVFYSETRKTAYAQVEFQFPELCQFQYTSYTVSVLEDTKMERVSEGPIIHFGRNSREVVIVLGPLEVGPPDGKNYTATVAIQSFTESVLSVDSTCEFTISDSVLFTPAIGTPSTQGVNGTSKRSVQLTSTVIGAIVVTVVVLLIVVVVNIVLLYFCLRYKKNKRYE